MTGFSLRLWIDCLVSYRRVDGGLQEYGLLDTVYLRSPF